MAGGRPSKYKQEYADQAAKLCALGATDAQLADFFEVAISTIYQWKIANPEFSDALKASKEAADDAVERSLFARALGYEHDEVDIRVVDHQIVKTPIKKIYPPDTTAAIFWLKNRRPEKWREMKAIEVSGAEGGPLQVQQVRRVIVDPNGRS